MTCYIKDLLSSQVRKVKANSLTEIREHLDCDNVLYNPYSKQSFAGWDNYKKSMSDSYNKRFGRR